MRAQKMIRGLEDGVHLPDEPAETQKEPRYERRNAFIGRWWSIVLKEFIQLKRDRVTFGMILGIPFCRWAVRLRINTNPKHLDTAIISAERHRHPRAASSPPCRTRSYFKVVGTLPNEQAGRDRAGTRAVALRDQYSSWVHRQLLRHEHPSLLIEADATDPTATIGALAAVNGIVQSVIQKELTGPLAMLQAARLRSASTCTSSTTPHPGRTTCTA